MSEQNFRQVFCPRKTALFLFYVLLFLILLQVAGLIMTYGLGHGRVFGLIRLFDFNTEQNIPTLFNTFLLILNAFLFYFVGKTEKASNGKSRWIWMFMSVIFLFLALDEFCEIHENLSEPFHERFNTSGLLYYAWVIPYGIAAIVLLLFFVPVWWKMEKRTRFLMALAVVLFLSGAILCEMFGGREYEQLGDQLDLKCGILATVEESLEMGGLILLLYTLTRMISQKYAEIIISFRDNKKLAHSES